MQNRETMRDSTNSSRRRPTIRRRRRQQRTASSLVALTCWLMLLFTIARVDGFQPLYPIQSSSSSWNSPSRRKQQRLSMVAKSGGKEILTDAQFSDSVLTTQETKPIMVFFTAPWCGPCRLSVPVVKEVMKQFSGKIEVVEVCTDDLPDVAADAGVVSIPTIQMYHRGDILDTIIGCVARNVLASAVTKVLEDIAVPEEEEENENEGEGGK